MKKIKIFDSTLRDGSQGEGISFSVEDKLKIVKSLDDLGISYVEAGNPGSNSKDLEFFERLKEIELKNTRVVAFGSTRRKAISVEQDPNVMALLDANTAAVAIFGKTWDFHVTDIIRATLDENLEMITDTIRFFKDKGKEVTFDAEHFFDGYKDNSDYALSSLEAAIAGGADYITLCDTNGGTFPNEVYDITKVVSNRFKDIKIGIHAHNDSELAVANSIMAVEAGATQVQGTFTGFGERCGNANLSAIIPNLQLKKGYKCIPDNQMPNLSTTARYISEVSNLILDNCMPYVGDSAFAHKGGMHIDGVNKASHSFEHIDPELVGNKRRFLMSEVAGRSSILSSIQKVDKSITKDSKEAHRLIEELKRLEHEGYQYEGAESSFELVVRRELGVYSPSFTINDFKTISEHSVIGSENNTSSLIKVTVDGKTEITAEQGNGPVNALDKALRKALEVFYPELKSVYLTDYKVRVLDTENTTNAKVRVIIESTDGKNTWSTVGVSSDIIEASLIALRDSIEYKLISTKNKKS